MLKFLESKSKLGEIAMTSFRKMKLDDLNLVSTFIAELNNIETSHIGYCGKEQQSIANDLMEEFDIPFTDSFVLAFEQDQLIGVVGFDADLESEYAEIWGPFIREGYAHITMSLWSEMEKLIPKKIKQLEMFPNIENTICIKLAQELNFEKMSTESILQFSSLYKEKLKETPLIEIDEKHFADMIKLHDETFPNTYYSGRQIIERMNDIQKVFILTNDDTLLGYIYVEVEPEFGDASIEFFAVKPSERGKGIGSKLILGALKWIFTFESIETVVLCVNGENKNAIHLYKKVGFEEEHRLYSYRKKY